jgi:acyl carrier protein
VAPRTPTEEVLARVWAEVLKLNQVGVEEDFFALGGTSLSVMRVPSAVKRALDREFSIVDVFRYPTVRTLAAYLDGRGQPMIDPAKLQVQASRRRAGRRMRLDPMRTNRGDTRDG